MLQVGDKAPDFNLPDANGNIKSLSEFKGKKLVLFFFPKANTPGWTVESQGFRDEFEIFKKNNINIIGVSADKVSRQKSFATKQNFQFILLSDVSKEMLKNYKVWGKKKFMGREYMGISRMTYVIDEEGIIIQVYEKVKAISHAKDILDNLKW